MSFEEEKAVYCWRTYRTDVWQIAEKAHGEYPGLAMEGP